MGFSKPTHRIWLPSLLLLLLRPELRPLSRDSKSGGQCPQGGSSPGMLGRAHPSHLVCIPQGMAMS